MSKGIRMEKSKMGMRRKSKRKREEKRKRSRIRDLDTNDGELNVSPHCRGQSAIKFNVRENFK